MDGGGRRFRLLVLLGSLAMIGSGFVPWWRSGGESVSGVQVPAAQGIGLEGPGLEGTLHRALTQGAGIEGTRLEGPALPGSRRSEQ